MPTKELTVSMPARSLNTYVFTIDPGAAAIDEKVMEEKRAVVTAYYDLHGRKLDTPSGLCIEKYADGSAKKVYIRP
jgi:glucuronoarabinoxylan endo-1,4-beta-xylanase